VESLLKTKKYALPIVVLNPYFLAGIAVTYLTNGRFELSHKAESVALMNQEQTLASGKLVDSEETFETSSQTSQATLDGSEIQ
jgi:hypothetical protein